jgi:glycosyltransferase involved in cell wall biosynthesis
MHTSKRIIALTQGARVPSTRFRWQQYVPRLRAHGLHISEFASRVGAYAPVTRQLRPFWMVASLAENLSRALRSRAYDLCFLQRNLTATLSTWESLLRNPLVFDVDDAIFLGPRGGAADRIAKRANLVICGNRFLAEHFSRFSDVAVLPTAVDAERFVPSPLGLPSLPVIGWSGSSSGLAYLKSIEPALKVVMLKRTDVRLKIVCDKPPALHSLPADRVEYEKWTPEREVAALQEFSVGIMPLEDSLWAQGKCSFKMLTYMAVGVPVVVSPVGMNSEVLRHGPCGFAARNKEEWVEALMSVIEAPSRAVELGLTGRRIINEEYSNAVIAPRLAGVLQAYT